MWRGAAAFAAGKVAADAVTPELAIAIFAGNIGHRYRHVHRRQLGWWRGHQQRWGER